MPSLCRLWRLLIAVLVFSSCAAFAQTGDPSAPASLDAVRASLDQIEKALQPVDLNDSTLLEIRSRLEPLSDAVRKALDERSPKFDAVKARLDQLGPKPVAAAAPEAASVTAERDDQQKQIDDLDAVIKRGRLLALQIDQTSDLIVARRRGLFTRALFAQSYSILSPELWSSAGKVLGVDAQAAFNVTQDWLSGIRASLNGFRMFAFLALTALIAIAYFVIARIERRVVFRNPQVHDPEARRKAIAAAWTFAVTACVPIFAALAFLALMRAFHLSNARMEPLVSAVFDSVTRVALTLGVTRGLLAPGLPGWRMLDWRENYVERVSRCALLVVLSISFFKITEAYAEIIVAALPVSIALRGLGSVMTALVLTAGLLQVSTPPVDEDDCLGPVVAPVQDWRVFLRVAGWVAAIAILISAFVGYIAFAAFLADQFIWAVFVGSILFLMMQLTQTVIAAGLRAQSKVGRAVVANIGIRRESLEQAAILLSGLVTLAMIVGAALLALAPWGVESNDMLSNVRNAFFGFKVGDVTISISSIFTAIAAFGLSWGLARALQGWLDTRFLPHTQLDVGLRNSIRTSVGYVGFVIAFSLALSYLGLSFEKLAIVAGALSVGIGFGLQSIVNNFVSGLILLWERAIRVGDWVVVGDEQGYVRRINVRSTEIETFDRATMIVPNSNLVTGVVKNWVRNDRVGRIRNPVSVNIGSDPEKVRAAMLSCAREHELVLKIPAPQVMFMSMTDNMLRFDLVCFVADVEKSGVTKSDLYYALFQSFSQAGIDMVTPTTTASSA